MHKIVIIGAGLTGLSLAHALKDSNYAITLLDHKPTLTVDLDNPSARFIALSYRSQKIFAAQGAWEKLQPYATPIRQIRISDRGHFGSAAIEASALQVDALGYSIQAQLITQVLLARAVAATNRLTLVRPITVTAIDAEAGLVTYQENEVIVTLQADLIIIADGGGADLIKLLNLEREEQNYQQIAIVANVQLAQSHRHIAYERFTASGPIAFLPIERNNMAVVWAVPADQAQRLLALDDAEFLRALQSAFGFQAGRLLATARRSSYALKLSLIKSPLKAKLLVLGNAAHTLHPVAAQGFNLTLGDVAYLAAQLQQHTIATALQNYIAERQPKQQRTINFTRNLMRIFSNNNFPITPLRGLALTLFNNCAPLKRNLARKIMGYYNA